MAGGPNLPPPGVDLSHVPLAPPPAGVIPNFVDPPSLRGEILAISSVLIALSTIFLSLRLYTRFVILRAAGLDDVLLFIGYILAVANTSITMAQTNLGLGRHAWDVPITLLFPSFTGPSAHLVLSFVAIKVYIASLTMIKLAILCLYPRLNPDIKFLRVTWGLMALVTTWGVASLLWNTFSCRPVSAFWRADGLITGTCDPARPFLLASGLFNVITDFVLVAVPIFLLKGVQLATGKKIGVIMLLSTGSLVSIISLIRMVTSVKTFSKLEDITYSPVAVYNWSSAELHSAVVCACMPVLRPFCSRYVRVLRLGTTKAASAATNDATYPPQSGSRPSNKNNHSLSSPHTVSTSDMKSPMSGQFEDIELATSHRRRPSKAGTDEYNLVGSPSIPGDELSWLDTVGSKPRGSA